MGRKYLTNTTIKRSLTNFVFSSTKIRDAIASEYFFLPLFAASICGKNFPIRSSRSLLPLPPPGSRSLVKSGLGTSLFGISDIFHTKSELQWATVLVFFVSYEHVVVVQEIFREEKRDTQVHTKLEMFSLQ